MSELNKAELRRLAEAAPEGPWFGPEYAPGTAYVFDVDLGTLLSYESIESEKDDCLRYVAAANPSTILSLLDELDSAEARLHEAATACATAEQERDQLRADAERARYWRQRAKSAEGHLWTSDTQAAIRALHRYSAFESIPWDELSGQQQALVASSARAVIAEVNSRRDARLPHDVRAEVEALREELGGIKSVGAATAQALKRLVMHARTSGGTAGPDQGLMDACEQAEKMLSIGGIGRAYMDGADAAMAKEGSANG